MKICLIQNNAGAMKRLCSICSGMFGETCAIGRFVAWIQGEKTNVHLTWQQQKQSVQLLVMKGCRVSHNQLRSGYWCALSTSYMQHFSAFSSAGMSLAEEPSWIRCKGGADYVHNVAAKKPQFTAAFHSLWIWPRALFLPPVCRVSSRSNLGSEQRQLTKIYSPHLSLTLDSSFVNSCTPWIFPPFFSPVDSSHQENITPTRTHAHTHCSSSSSSERLLKTHLLSKSESLLRCFLILLSLAADISELRQFNKSIYNEKNGICLQLNSSLHLVLFPSSHRTGALIKAASRKRNNY